MPAFRLIIVLPNPMERIFLNAGDMEWGRKMLYDLADGVKWAIDRNIADPEKIAVFGRSYGGYAHSQELRLHLNCLLCVDILV
jgi:dipeptidyl aminopeptidase/acylaminoacyl peptidase